MARTIEEIQDSILENKKESTALTGLELNTTHTNTHKTSIWQLWVYIMAYAIRLLELIFDQHTKDITKALNEQKAHTAKWYRSKALAFQEGVALMADSDQFDNKDQSPEEIVKKKIVKYAAVTERVDDAELLIKIAGEDTEGTLSALTNEQVNSFKRYMQKIKDAGVKITVISYKPDILSLDLIIEYDPLVLKKDGRRIDDNSLSVENAINAYMKELPFDGELVLAHLVDKLQQVEGVRIPTINSASSAWVSSGTDEYENPQFFEIKVIPKSGYFTVNDFSKIKYVV